MSRQTGSFGCATLAVLATGIALSIILNYNTNKTLYVTDCLKRDQATVESCIDTYGETPSAVDDSRGYIILLLIAASACGGLATRLTPRSSLEQKINPSEQDKKYEI